MIAIILAGGGGTRLWPVSRRKVPKQMLPLIGGDTLLQRTYRRVRRVVPPRNIVVVTNERYATSVRRQLPELPSRHILKEPEKRDTAAAIGFAATWVAKRDPSAIVFTVNSDQYVSNEAEYRRTLRIAERAVGKYPGRTALIGIPPSDADTGLGYIERGKHVGSVGGRRVFTVKRFVEKPDRASADRFVRSRRFFWNPAFFFWRVDNLLAAFRRHLPVHADAFEAIGRALGTRRELNVLRRLYPRLPKISIDYGIIEKLEGMIVVPASFGWRDVGHWRTIHEVLRLPSGEQNVVQGTHVGLDTERSLIYAYGKRVVATAGLKDFIVVDTPDALLICPKDRAQDVKHLVEELETKGFDVYL